MRATVRARRRGVTPPAATAPGHEDCRLCTAAGPAESAVVWARRAGAQQDYGPMRPSPRTGQPPAVDAAVVGPRGRHVVLVATDGSDRVRSATVRVGARSGDLRLTSPVRGHRRRYDALTDLLYSPVPVR